MELIHTSEIAARLATAAILAGMVGLERERKEWVAGLRTHILVGIGAALAMIVSAYGFSDVVGKQGIELDPSRIAAQVISGVGFLGAGTILFLRQEVIRGLTTAAGLWSVAAVGLASGGGMYTAAIIATILILFVLAGIKWIEKKWFGQQTVLSLSLTVRRSAEISIVTIEKIFNENDISIKRFSIHTDEGEKEDNFLIFFNKFSNRKKILSAIEKIKEFKGISEVKL